VRPVVPWIIVVAAALAGIAAVRAELRDRAPVTTAPAVGSRSPGRAPEPSPNAGTAAAPTLTRDLTQYGDAPTPTPTPTVTHSFGGIPLLDTQTSRDAASTPAPRAALIGFVRRPSGTQGVFSLDGAVELAAAGSAVRGWRVLAIDASSGSAQVRSPEGDVMDLLMGGSVEPSTSGAAEPTSTPAATEETGAFDSGAAPHEQP
jgi:hypothetical protein